MNSLTIIIPVFNEAEQIEKTILPLLQDRDVEIIVVDGGSTDRTLDIALALGVKTLVSPQKGRANQMNTGAAVATGDILLFLHADTRLPTDYREWVQKTLSEPQIVAGAFELAIDGEQKSLRWVEKMVHLRSYFLSLPYGDQAIFLKASVFKEMGGFAQLPIMEDFELVQRLNKKGRIAIVPRSVLTSQRRWKKLGVWQTTLLNQLIILGYYLGISPHQLARWYRHR